MGAKRARAARDRKRSDAGPDDEVVCLLCGKAFRAITVTHLRRWHNFDGEHPVRDYCRRFGLRVGMCRESCRSIRDLRIERAIRDGRHWTRERIRKELRRRARDSEPVSSAQLENALSLAIGRLYGPSGWEPAMRDAGLDPDAHRLTGFWSEAKLYDGVRARHARGESLVASLVEQSDPSLFNAAYRLCGNWSKALRAAGFDPKDHRLPGKWDRAKARAWVEERRANGLPFIAANVPQDLYDYVTARVRGGWTAFVESLGIPYPGLRKRKWTDADVVSELRRLRRARHPLDESAVIKAFGQALRHQARKRFGSWDDALRAAGVDPAKTRLARPWSRSLVVAAIRDRYAAGKTIARPRVREEDQGLARAAEKYFRGGWPEALRAAGLDPTGLFRPGVRRARRK